jgi:DNA-binding SARP family transcriptional activator/tetratricopeptide (TPR) repeat protein
MLQVSLLGEQYADGGGAGPGRLSPRSIMLLAFLVLHANAPQPRQLIAGVFWPDSTEAQARTNLRRELHLLRLTLDSSPSLVVDATTLMWRDAPGCRVDVRVFATERQQALAARAAGDHDAMLAHAEAAVAEYRADLMPGVYDDWVVAEREVLRRQCTELCDMLVSGWQARRDLNLAREFAQQRVRLEPLDETGYQALMQLQYELGDRSGAIGTFHRCAEILERELGVKPTDRTNALAQSILGVGRSNAPSTSGQSPTVGLPRTRLVGRTRELGRMLECWNRARHGSPALLVVAGDAGVGKSRLIEELANRARSAGAVVATTRCFGMAARPALAPVADWLRSPSLRRALGGLDEVWQYEVGRLIPSMADAQQANGRPRPERIVASRAMVEAWRRHRFFEGLARAVLAVDRPTLLVLDDLQWCDEETIAWLPFLLNLAYQAPLLIATTVRDEELDDKAEPRRLLRSLASAGMVVQVDVPPLGREDITALGASLLSRPLREDEALLLVEASGGYPLYVVEAVRSTQQHGSRGALPLRADAGSVLGRRLEEASPHARDVAALAAAVGRDFSLDLLSEASDLDEDSVVRSVDELWRHRIIREHGTGYDFTHDLVRDAAYALVSPPQRWLLHRRLAQGLELLHVERADDVAAQLAEQYDRGGRPDRACHYYQRAAELAAAVFANAEAVRFFRRSLELTRRQPPGRGRQERELEVLQAMSAPLNAIHGYSSAILQETLEQCASLAQRLANPRALMASLVGLFAVRFVQGNIVDSHRLALRALELAESQPEAAGQAHLAVAGSATSLGMLQKAATHFERARELSRGSVSLIVGTLPEVHTLAWQAHARWLLGDEAGALASCREAADIADAAGHPYSLAMALGYTATTHQLLADKEGAAAAAAKLVSICRRHEFAFYGEWGVIVQGWVMGGPEGIDQINQGLNKLRGAGSQTRMPYWLTLLAQAMVACDRTDSARAVLAAAQAAAEQHEERWWLPEVLRLRAGLLPPEVAAPLLWRGAVMARDQHSNVLRQRCEADLAVLGVPAAVAASER